MQFINRDPSFYHEKFMIIFANELILSKEIVDELGKIVDTEIKEFIDWRD